MAEIKEKKPTVEETSSQFEERLLPPELPFPEVRRLELNLGPTASPTWDPMGALYPFPPIPGP